MKFLFSLLFITSCLTTLSSQEFVSDFTATDINGEEHNLYELLDDGKMVILDIYATWCGPCWDLHESGVLKDLWESHGPDGSDEIFIFSIESDINTTPDDLIGIGSATLGDWTENVPYPIIDETEVGMSEGFALGEIASSFDVIGYPTIVFICPDRTFSEVSWQSINQTFPGTLADCAVPVVLEETNIRLEAIKGDFGDNCGQRNFKPEVLVRNVGNEEVSSFTADLYVDGTSIQQIEYSGSINTYEGEKVIFDDVTFDSGSYTWSIEVTEVNGETIDDDPTNNVEEVELRVANETDKDSVVIRLNTDDNADEIYWAIFAFDNLQVPIAEGGNTTIGIDQVYYLNGPNVPFSPDSYENNQEYEVTVEIPDDGCYFFVINDYQTDGFAGDGFIQLEDMNGEILVEDPPFSGDLTFLLPNYLFSKQGGSVSTNDLSIENITIYPNPSSDFIRIESESSESITLIEIYDLNGRLVSRDLNYDGRDIKVGDFESGIYLLRVKMTYGKTVNVKFVKG